MAVPIDGMHPGETLEAFHHRCVVPESDEIERKNQVIDGFIRFLHQEFSGDPHFTVSEVIKGGSLGKGTAVRGQSDCDLVVYFNNIGSLDKLQSSRRRLLDAIERGVISYPPFQSRIEKKGRSTFSVEYEFQGENIDILPAFDVVDSLQGKENVYSRMSTRNGFQYSASLAPLQVDFVKHCDDTVKKVIRLLKYWKKKNNLYIRSYTLELVTIHANSLRHGDCTVPQLFKHTMKLLSDCDSLEIAFKKNYDIARFSTPKPPYVMDPANPFMNTLRGAKTGDVRQKARDTLRLL